jgi:hypothetical protein
MIVTLTKIMNDVIHSNNSIFKEFNVNSIDHKVDEKLIIDLLGYNIENVPEPVIDSIRKVFNDIPPILEFKGGYKIFEPNLVKIGKEHFEISDLEFYAGKIISFNLKGSETLSILVGTIGSKISEYLNNLMESGDALTGYIADQIVSEIVERWMDSIECELENSLISSERKITNRYSPGYCGWDVSDQHKLFSLLPENICGIKLTESALMIPIKSVSAVIGIGKNVERKDYQCSICDIEFCYKRVRNE